MKFEHTSVYNFDNAFRGMRNALESWKKSDSNWNTVDNCIFPEHPDGCAACPAFHGFGYPCFQIGENDMGLARRLINAGDPSHRKFLRQIFVSVDITAPLYWWKEADTYKIGTVANSTSTMHKLASTPITMDCFETDDYCGNELDLIDDARFGWRAEGFIDDLEQLRLKYLETKDKRYWKELIRWLPNGWLQTRTWTANYEVLRAIYHQRKNHKLTEWHQFCEWIESLPYAKELIID